MIYSRSYEKTHQRQLRSVLLGVLKCFKLDPDIWIHHFDPQFNCSSFKTDLFHLISVEGEKYKFEEDNPFIEDSDDEDEEKAAKKNDKVASVGYRYRKWDLGNGVKLVARCEHDAVTRGPSNDLQFVNIKVRDDTLKLEMI